MTGPAGPSDPRGPDTPVGADAPGCPRCPRPVVGAGPGRWRCAEHGEVPPLRRPDQRGYAAFLEHLHAAGDHPTVLPWPLGPTWTLSDHAWAGEPGCTVATLTCCSGASALDGPVDVMVVVEEPGVGLGARVAGVGEHAPGVEPGAGPPTARVRLDHQQVALWALSTSGSAPDLDRSVLVGEAGGRWLWLVLRPASAILLLREDWLLRAAADLGPVLVEIPFGGPRPPW